MGEVPGTYRWLLRGHQAVTNLDLLDAFELWNSKKKIVDRNDRIIFKR